MEKIIHQLLRHEAFREKPYHCTAGKITIGIGRNLDDKGITLDAAMILLKNDIAECEADLKTIFPNWKILDPVRWRVLIDMRFNLGPGRFRGFRKMIDAVQKWDYKTAALEMQNSAWYGQVGTRARTLCEMMETGRDLII